MLVASLVKPSENVAEIIDDTCSSRYILPIGLKTGYPQEGQRSKLHEEHSRFVHNPPSTDEASQYDRSVNVIKPSPQTKLTNCQKTTVPTFVTH